MLGGISSSIVAWPKINVKQVIGNLLTGNIKACGGGECPEGCYEECDSCCPPVIELKEETLTTYFCPEDNCLQMLLDEFGSAKSSIHLVVDYFTKDELADALKEVAANGIEVKIIFDNCSGSGVDYEELTTALGQDGTRVKKDIDYTFAIIDKKTIVIGPNYTSTGLTENESHAIIVNSSELAESYEAEFQALWDEGVIGCP